jgi:hypothetical protein
MKPFAIVSLAALPALAAGAVLAAGGDTSSSRELKPAASFASISDEKQRSVALFEEAGKVIQHARCVNCHPAGDRPLQGDNRHPHQPLVVRGPDGLGATGMRCTTCHGPENVNHAHLPGHPLWHLAPIEMAWEGKKLGEICEQIKDEKRNGGKTLAQIVEHMSSDSLVGWGWKPDPGREPVPGTQAEFGALIKAWADTGAACPAS